ncbi:tumor necrosis factor ligand superfamily member 8 [Manacus vitellinus]|uniref:tumor necrosis factor ligand superfamily member 8 n=1 Tax=Manacus vitellinus TaxID=328815 RepID=UPI00115E1AF0|nr:tumor necrosis factor ligand superfamily member 8 [Manacus vitellinus]XP_051664010.1 tumor necrosis factor ligand superfamily member 8 [Manacus candei]
MCQAQEQAVVQVRDSRESAMHGNEGAVPRRLGGTNRIYLYFIIATLVALLVFALATIMILVVQRTAPDPAMEGIKKPIRTGNTFEDYSRILQRVPTKGAAAYMRVANPGNSSKLSLVQKGICEDIQCRNEELVIKEQGVYLIYCHLNFHLPNCSKSPTDLKIELLVNDRVDRQTLSTWCESERCQGKAFKTLFQLHLTHLKVEDRISVALNHPQFLNEDSLPNENVLGVLMYSDQM